MDNKNESLILSHHNCISLVITNIVHSKSIDYRQIWKQMGLMSYLEENKLRFYPRYRSLKSELAFLNNIYLREYICDEKEEFQILLEKLIKQDRIFVVVDAYYLPYCLNYNDSHEFHYIEIKKCKSDGNYEIFDPLFHFEGELLADSLYMAMSEGRKLETETAGYVLCLLDTSAYSDISVTGIKEVIMQNIIAMSEENNLDFYKSALPFQQPLNTGLSVFNDIQKTFEHMDIEVVESIYLENLYTDFKEISNSRYIYAAFLESFLETESCGFNINELHESYVELGHDWNVVANMILKLAISKNAKLLPRICRKIQNINEKEINVIRSQEINS
ncbi:hypothetical protein HP573_27125 [Bacillus cereus]|nr:hypothetical protein [Bacillus cereus]